MGEQESHTMPFTKGPAGKFHYYQWIPEQPTMWLHILHGMSEHSARYCDLANFLGSHGILVTAGDHRGHGETGKAMHSSYHVADKDGWNLMLDDQLQFLQEKSNYFDLPLVIMGHSMGSFMATHFCQTRLTALTQSMAKPLLGLILSGSNYAKPYVYKAASVIARIERRRCGHDRPSNLLEKLSFGHFNNAFQPARTESDWLSRDNNAVDHYINDPLCGGPLSTQSWCDFLQGMADLSRPDAFKKISSALPIYMFSGDQDPVGQQGIGVTALLNVFTASGQRNITKKMYLGGRHEMLNETNKTEVYEDLKRWLMNL